MDRRPPVSDQAIRTGVRYFLQLPRQIQVALVILALVAAVIWLVVTYWPRSHPAAPPPAAGANPDGSGTYQFCFWNVENLFDDRDDHRRPPDREYDAAFAEDADLRDRKYDRIAGALVRMNGGRGPDVIACAEVESPRAAELLKDALNRKLDEAKADPALKYANVAMKDLDAGRHIAPCVISRLPLDSDRTRLRGPKLRILETHLTVNGYDLTVIASHWRSQLQEKGGGHGEAGREKYGTAIHELFARQARADAKADVLVCGDFNETPDAPEVVNALRATGDRARVTPAADDPFLLDLLAGKPPDRFGTHWYNGRPLIYDQICVSAGMLDGEGWSCDPDSVAVVTDGLTRSGATRREPWRFGGPRAPPSGGRGYSDHFPVTVTLKVAPPTPE